ncbi:MAG: bifunctional precorrin-2 dehydrogenase/sirohydrochlorin ferrochelatase [Planctomycetota bacterium]
MGRYPIFLDMTGRRVVLIGGGRVAFRKAQALLDSGARLVIIAEHFDKLFEAIAKLKQVELVEARYSGEYLTGALMVIAATNDNLLNERIFNDCRQADILCNIVDAPSHCDFLVPAVVKRGNLTFAISTEGNCPAYAGHIRKKLEKIFTEEHGRFLAELEKLRQQIFAIVPDKSERKILLGRLADDESFDYFIEKGPAAWNNRADQLIKKAPTTC